MLYLSGIVCILMQVCSSDSYQVEPSGWNYINLHCRNNDNKPVDWWYMYKPPLGYGLNLDMGTNFSYITPGVIRWQPSMQYINADSMLQHTLSPLYRPTYTNNLAVIAYSGKRDNVTKGTSAHGILMADELGGVWMEYTVPGLIDLTADRPMFPASEINRGHLMMCLSLDLPTLNLIAASIRQVALRILRVRVPPSIRELLPNWRYFNRRVKHDNLSLPARPIEFQTTEKSLQATLLIRRPGEKQCLLRAFARAKGIVLDVYGHGKQAHLGCDKNFGLRKINSISLKYPESVYYIDNKTDRINFAVSTAAHWQMRGDGPTQHWACTSTVEREDAAERGGLVLCVQHYAVWWSFDNMKIKEPKC